MICYNCGLKVHNTNANDCQFCGVRFGSYCSSCMAPNPTMAKYCFNCGSHMNYAKESSSIQNYSILAESRKNVAVLFADISGFTILSEKLDPEVVREIINDCFNYITTPVYEFGGTIDKYIGDCVMALFGAKTTHIDDAKRAVLCALKMSKLIQEFNEERIKPLGYDLQLSIGVHYGLVVTGRVGNYYDMDYTVMGDTVNTAQRIQSNTPKSCIYVSGAVYKETNVDIQYSNPVEISVKNKENPILCYTPLTIINAISNEQENLPMIGRQSSLEAIGLALEAVNNTYSGVVAVIGSAGVGKTMLTKEFLQLCSEDLKIITHECNPASSNSPYSLLNNLLMSMMNINTGEALIVKQSRVVSYISLLMSNYDETIIKRNCQFISFLLGMEIDKETRDIIAAMDAKNMFREISYQLSLLLREFEYRTQALVLIEDMHWADAKSLAMLKEIWQGNADRHGKNLYIYTSRAPIEELRDLEKDNYWQIALEPLDAYSISKYISQYMGCEAIDSKAKDYIVSFSGGNPLYMHELLKYIKKHSLFYISDNTLYLKKDIEKIPNSLQGLILSKLNYISNNAVEIVQAASIIGKDFTLSVLGKLLGKDLEAEEYLREAVNSNIVYLKSTYTYINTKEVLYSFSHETERETIYNSMLNSKKVASHREAANAIETLYARDIENYYEVLGMHFEKGNETSKAFQYYFNAAQHYGKLLNTQEALSYYLKAYSTITKLKNSSREKLYSVCLQVGELYSVVSDFKNSKLFLNRAHKYADNNNEVWEAELALAKIYKEQAKYKEAIKILDNIQEQMKLSNKLYGSVLSLKCNIQRVMGQTQKALDSIRKAESILQKNKDYDNLAKVLNAVGAIYQTTSDSDNALKYYTKAYKYAEKVGDLQTLMKCAGNIATINHIHGEVNNAIKFYNIGMDIAKKISHRQGYVIFCSNLGILNMDKGFFQKSKELCEEAAKIAKETSALFLQSAACSNLADISYYLGDYKTAVKYAALALEISKDIEDIEGEGVNNIILAKINIEQGKLQDAKGFLELAKEIYSQLDNNDGWSDYHYFMAQYYLALNALDKAFEHAMKAKELSSSFKSRRKLARILRFVGILHQKSNDFTASIGPLSESIDLLEKEEASYELLKSYYFRAAAYNKLSNPEASNKDLKAAAMYNKKIDKCKWTKVIEHGIN